jgi:hypothetical protein
MTKIRTLQGAAHDVVDHSLSAFGWLHPHVWEYAKSNQLNDVQIDLASDSPIAGSNVPTPLRLAAEGLHTWFLSLLNSYGIEPAQIASATLRFGAFGSDPHSPAATCVIVSAGREFRYDRGWPSNLRLHPT